MWLIESFIDTNCMLGTNQSVGIAVNKQSREDGRRDG